jgi:hypothetical protein
LFSHKDVFPSSHYTVPSVAPSVAATDDLMDGNSSWGDGSVARMGDDHMADGDDDHYHDNVVVDQDEVLLLRGDSDDIDNSSHASVVFGEDGPRVSNLSTDDWSLPDDSEVGLNQRRMYEA